MGGSCASKFNKAFISWLMRMQREALADTPNRFRSGDISVALRRFKSKLLLTVMLAVQLLFCAQTQAIIVAKIQM